MKKKGRFSLVLSIIIIVLGVAEITLGALYCLGLLSIPVLSSLMNAIEANLALFCTGYGVVTPGILLLLIGLMMISFRNRKPFSHFYEVYVIPEYLTLEIFIRQLRGEPMPQMINGYLEKAAISSKTLLLGFALALEVVLGLFLLYLASFLDSSWRRKRDWKMKKLIHDGVLPSEEEEAADKERIHQEKLNAIEEKKIARQVAKQEKERAKAEAAERKRAEKEAKRDQKSYEKLREKKERKREAEEAKARAREAAAADKEREKAEIQASKEAKLARKEERRALKEQKKLKSKADAEDELPPLEFAASPANPNNPLEFPSFSEMPELKTIEHADAVPAAEADDIHEYSIGAPIESNIIGAVKDDIERPMIQSDENGHFRSGGMIEATLESFNSQSGRAELPPQRPIIGYDDVPAKTAGKTNGSRSSFAPSNLSPDHPRYRLFQALQNNEHPAESAVHEKEDPAPAPLNSAPSNLSPDHPRYKLFQNLQNDRRPEPPAEPKTEKSSIAPSGLSPDHPRYKLFQAIADKAGTGGSVTHFPGKAFQPEEDSDEEIIRSTYEEAPKVAPASFSAAVEERPMPDRNQSAEPQQVRAEESQSFRMPASAAPEVVQQKAEPSPYSGREETYRKPSEPDSSSVAAADEGAEETGEQENELELSVGIGGLSSNNMGFYAIKQRSQRSYAAPPVSLLTDYPSVGSELDPLTISKGNIIVEALAQQKVYVELIDIIKGPTVTMYELKLAEGTIISKIKAREAELNYALGGSRIRILAPVPGKQAVGIEVPNATRDTIGFKDMIYALRASDKYMGFKVPMILGKTITGEPVVIDVCKMPHMIIAGTTGSGKSVCINSFINTILYQKGPKEVRLLMVDPKMVELSMYNGIPHLLTPVITDAKRVVKVLNWLVEEMERRYQMISKFGVRNIEGLNDKLAREHIAAERMPYIVLIMDEFADMMSVVGKDIENLVARLTAKARAAGIHLILATQRPSADVITGTIKSNLPARIAFAVSSGTNSRVILDEGGAESLLGKGDMLLLNPSVMGLQRIQGAFLSDGEVDAISSFVRKNAGEPDYLSEDLFEDDDRDSDSGDSSDVILSDSDSDEALYEQAKSICFERKCASASYLQRRMKIGYNRAARLIEMMEEDGIVGEAHGSKPREILRYE